MTRLSSGAADGLEGLTAVACRARRRAASASRRAGELGETTPVRRGRSGVTAARPWPRGGRERDVARPVAAKGFGLFTATVVRPSRAGAAAPQLRPGAAGARRDDGRCERWGGPG